MAKASATMLRRHRRGQRARWLSPGSGWTVRLHFGEVEAKLDEFEIPVAELAPEELVDGVGRFVETIVLQCLIHFNGHCIEAREDPTRFNGRDLRQSADRVRCAHGHLVTSGACAVDLQE